MSKVKALAFLALLAAVTAPGLGHAQPVPGETPAALMPLVRDGARLAPIGKIGGLDGWLAKKGDMVQTVYLTPDGRHYIAGIGFSEEGRNVTAESLDVAMKRGDLAALGIEPKPTASTPSSAAQAGTPAAAVPQVPSRQASATPPPQSARPPVLTGEQVLAAIEADSALSPEKRSLTWLSFGKVGAPVVYMAADLSCPYCKRAWVQLAPEVDAGRIELRIIPVAIVSPASRGQALALLDAEDPRKLWIDNVTASIPPAQVGSEAAMAAIEANNAFFGPSLRGTPSFWLRKGGRPQGVAGLPHDLSSVLP